MIKPNIPSNFIGKSVKSIDGRTGFIERIGGLTEKPWILFSENNISIIVQWESIEVIQDAKN
jgi:hypothetical protein